MTKQIHKRLLLVLINIVVLIVHSIGQAQVEKRDHLYFSDLVKAYINKGDYQSALHYSDSAILVLTDEQPEVTYLYRGVIFNLLRQTDSAKHYQRMVEPLLKDTTEFHTAIYYQLCGLLARTDGKFTVAEHYLTKELKLLESFPDKIKQRGACLINLATAQMLGSKFVPATENFVAAMKVAESLADTTLLLKSLINGGICYSYLRKHEKSVAYQKQALELAQQSDNSRLAYFAIANLGTQYERLKQYPQAKKYLQQCINNKDHTFNKKVCLHTLGIIYSKEEKLDSAIILAKETVALNKEIKNISGLRKAQKQLATYYRKNKELEKAEVILDEVLAGVVEDGDLYMQWYTYDELINLDIDKYKISSLTKNWDAYREVRDSIYSKEMNQAVANAETKYQTEKKEAENQLLQQEKKLQTAVIKQQRTTLLASVSGLGLLALISLLFYRQSSERKKTNMVLAQQKKQIEIQNQELSEKNLNIETLHKELAHRVKNNLAFISALMSMQQDRLTNSEAKEAVKESELRLQSMSLLHRKLHVGEQSYFNIADYLNELCANLQHSFVFDGVQPTITVVSDDLKIKGDLAMRLGLIINELVTNSFKYAFASQDRPKINIDLQQTGTETYRMIYQDNGEGIPADFDIKNSKSLGLKLIHTMTRQLNGTLAVSNKNGAHFQFNFTQKKFVA